MPNPRFIPTYLAAGLAIATAFVAGCGDTPAGPGPAERSARVVRDVSPFFQLDEIRATSVLDRALLRVSSAAGTVTQSAAVGPNDRIVEFTVTVPTGEVRFEAAVESNNRTVLFDGATVATVAQDGFEVAIETRARAPVLVVTPDSLQVPVLQPEMLPAFFVLENRGVGTVEWSLVSVDPPLNSCGIYACLGLGALSRTVDRGRPTQLFVWGVNTPARSYRIRLATAEGTVDLRAAAEATPRGGIEARMINISQAPVAGWEFRLEACVGFTHADDCVPDGSMPLQTRVTDSAGVALFAELPVGRQWRVTPVPQVGWVIVPQRRLVTVTADRVLTIIFQRMPIVF
jgi:hypothetical protein